MPPDRRLPHLGPSCVKNILRTKDYVTGIPKAEIEDILR